MGHRGKAVQVDPILTALGFQRSKLKYDKLLSSFAFNVNLRRYAMVHNIAHIELNAIDLAWDTVARFSSLHPELPTSFFADFAHVADDESRHLGWWGAAG